MNEDRRSFLKRAAGYAGLGLGCGFPLLDTACSDSSSNEGDGRSSSNQWAMVIDIQKCLLEDVRRACTKACNREHNVPEIPDSEEEVKWIWSEDYEDVFPDQAHQYTAASLKDKPVLVLCNHCTHPQCVKVCPTRATWKRKQDGIVMMDMHRCIGCRYCMAACPYGARSFNWRDPRPYLEVPIRPEFPTRAKGVVEKCNFCAERLRSGLEPACVVSAREVSGGEGALTFGDLSDPDSNVSRLLRQEHTICRRLSLGTGPNVFYIV